MLFTFSIFFTFLLLGTNSNETDEKIRKNKIQDRIYVQRQELLFQMLWSPEKLFTSDNAFVRTSSTIKIEDILQLVTDRKVSERFYEHYKHDLVPRNLPVTFEYPAHLNEIRRLTEFLLNARSFNAFYLTATWANHYFNQFTWRYSVLVASMLSPETRFMHMPKGHETLPNYFFNAEVIRQLKAIKNSDCKTTSKKEKVISAVYSKTISKFYEDEESSITYFTEDVDLANYYFFVTTDVPKWIAQSQLPHRVYRRGERFYHHYQQLLARYNLERSSHELSEIEDIDWDHNIVTGFVPQMVDYNGEQFPMRPSNSPIMVQKYKYLQLIKDYETRLNDAADKGILNRPMGYFLTDKNVTTSAFFSYLMDAVQGNADSVNRVFYGEVESLARHVLSFNSEPSSKFNLSISALENPYASLRDPMFYRLIKRIVGIGNRYKCHLQPYEKAEINFPGIAIEKVKVDKVTTFFETHDSIIGKQICANDTYLPILVRQERLNHSKMKVKIKVRSSKSTLGIFRLFIGPKYNERGYEIGIDEARMAYFQLDMFWTKLTTGINIISRDDEQFAIQAPPARRSDEVYSKILGAVNKEDSICFYKRPQGWPRHLLIPRGKKGGQIFRIFAIVTPYSAAIETTETLIAGYDIDDGRPLGFPLDKPIKLSNFLEKNMAYTDLTVSFQGTQ